MNNKGAEQNVGMHRLVWAFVVHMQQIQAFLHLGPFTVQLNLSKTTTLKKTKKWFIDLIA